MNNKKWEEMTVEEKLTEAIKNAKDLVIRKDGVNYFESTCRLRDPRSPEHEGSVFARDWLGERTVEDAVFGEENFKGTAEDLPEDFLEDFPAKWEEYPNCPNLMPGCEAFHVRFVWSVGRSGVIPSKYIHGDVELTLTDTKNTGHLSAVLNEPVEKVGNFESEIVAIVGDEGGKKVLFTFHPGVPIPPSTVEASETLKAGDKITALKAYALGFDWVKLA